MKKRAPLTPVQNVKVVFFTTVAKLREEKTMFYLNNCKFMKNTLLYFIKMCSAYFFVGIIAQSMLYTLVIAGETKAQAKSIEEVTVSIGLDNASFYEFIDQVEQQTDFTFFFEKVKLNRTKAITLQAKNQKLAEVLRELSKMTGFSFRQVNYNIGVFKSGPDGPLIMENKQSDQDRTITGKVTAEDDGSPIPGATVMVKGTTNGTVTDINGNYSLNVADPNAVMIFSYVGYLTEEVAINNRSVVDISLMMDITELSELVVVGYGTQSERTVTGAISTLSADKIESKPVANIGSALQGQVSGVTVTNTGSPGVAPTVRIRGVSSVSYASNPLYVIDGVPVGDLNNFDVKSIESISVLKDASSAAIYGSRGTNGVIIITTKSGKYSQKNTLNVDFSYGFQKAWKQLDLLNTKEYLQYGTELLTNGGLALPYRFEHMNEPIYPGATQTYAQTNTDWQDEMFRTAPISQINVSFSGGSENSRFYTAYGRFSQEGIMLGTGYDRHNFRINSDSKLGKAVTIGQNLNVSYSERDNERVTGGRTIIKHIVNQAPFVPVYNPENVGGYAGPVDAGSDAENPVRIAELETNQNHVVNLVGNVYGELELFDWLTFRSSFGAEYTSNRDIVRLPIFSEGPNARNENELTDNRFTFFRPVVTNQLTFDKWIDKHYFNVVAVAEQEQTKIYHLQGSGRQPNNIISQLEGSSAQAVNGFEEVTVLQSYAGRLQYTYDDKYLLNLSLRRDGSSVFAPGNKWGTFPGGSIGWVVSRENFMQNVTAVSNLKLRASYGTTGFNALAAYPWQSNIATNTTAVFNNKFDNVGAYFDRLPNRDLKWEITTMTNFGFDLALLDNAVSLSAEYYTRETDNLIVDTPLARSMGYSVNIPTNIGTMRNYGFDFSAGYNKSFGEFHFAVDGNLTLVNNDVVDMGGAPISKGGVTSDYGEGSVTYTDAGYPIQGFYGYVVEGIFQTQADIDALNNLDDPANEIYYQTAGTSPGDIKFKDLNDDGVVDENDRTVIGSYLPDFTYGLNLNASYKGFSASVFLQGVQGNDIYNGTKVLTQGMTRLFNAEKEVLNAWTPTNTNTDIPRAVSGDPNQNARISDRFVEDGSYMRIKNVTLSYSLPEKMLSSVLNGTVSGLKVYFTAQNLLTFTNYSGYDPEIGASSNYSGNENATLLQGVDFGFAPQPRTFILGMNVSF